MNTHLLRGLLLLLLLTMLPGSLQAQERQEALDASGSDFVLIIDHSESMQDNDPTFSRLDAAKLFIDLANPGDRIGIVVMSGAPVGRSFNQTGTRALTRRMVEIGDEYEAVADTRELKDMVDSLSAEPMGGYTHMGPALNLAYGLLDDIPIRARTPNENQFVVMLTDGKPTSEQGNETAQALVAEAARTFQNREHWHIFAIALGSAAAPDYLRQAVAQPTGGTVVPVEHASGLLDAYLDIYALVEDDRFIDRVTVPTNMLSPLVHIQPDHQVTRLSFVIIPGESGARIRQLQAPDRRDIVDPSLQHSIRRGTESAYELYTVPPDAPVRLHGAWQIDVERADGAPQQVVVLSQTRLRIQMIVPPPLEDGEPSLRYHPVGRPLHMVVGAQVAERDLEGTPDQQFRYRQVTDMAIPPTIQVVEPQVQTAHAARDDGRMYDRERSDGHYTLLHPPLGEGKNRIRVEIAPQQGDPIHIHRDYLVRVTLLPTITLTLAELPDTLRVTMPLTGSIHLPAWPDFQMHNIVFPPELAFVRRPDGTHDPLKIEPVASGHYQFVYEPGFAGEHHISIIAYVKGSGTEGVIHYADYVEQAFTVQPPPPTISITPAFSETLVADRAGRLQIPLSIETDALPEDELLHVEVVGLDGQSRVTPDTLRIEPSQLARLRSVMVYLPEQAHGEDGTLSLAFRTSDPEVVVLQSQIPVSFKSPFPLPLVIVTLASVLLVAGVGLGAYRYRARR